jgi:hypothetical protein
MAENTLSGRPASLVRIGSGSGHTIIEPDSPLRRLHYFDGKFLRAPDLLLEQQALLNQVRIANRAGGAGVVHGFDCRLAGGDGLALGAGLAFDPEGRPLMLHQEIRVAIEELIEKSRAPAFAEPSPSASATRATSADFDECVIRRETADIGVAERSDLYLISLHHAEAYCGEEEVYGRLCSEACTTSTNRSYILEGVEVRATPLALSVLLKPSQAVALSDAHLRSRVAAAYFEQERQRIPHQLSASGLTSNLWCRGAEAAGGNGVPIAVIGRRGGTTLFLDAWTARRERMETPPRHYWAGRMMMRPWPVFLAQVLQFQCQLHACLSSTDPDAPCKTLVDFDPCADTRRVAGQAAEGMRFLLDRMTAMASRLADVGDSDPARARLDLGTDLSDLERRYQQLIDASRIAVPDRLMIHCGIVEVPSAGYLPVNVSSTVTVNEQVARLFGPGVDLRFCVVRPDFVAHALEEAQHMERICLLRGLEDASQRPEIDVLVPNGEIERREAVSPGTGYRASLELNSQLFELGWPRTVFRSDQLASRAVDATGAERLLEIRHVEAGQRLPTLSGAARGERTERDGLSFHCAAQSGRDGLQEAVLARVKRSVDAVLESLDERQAAATTATSTTATTTTTTTATAAETLSRLVASRSSLVPSVVLWLELTLDEDPFRMANGDTATLRARSTVVISGTRDQVRHLTIEERRLNGQLQITRSAPQQRDTRLTARLIADGHWRRLRLADGQTSERSEPVALDERVIISRAGLAGLPPTIAIQLVNPSFFAGLDNVQLVFERSWVSANESRARVLLRYQGREANFAQAGGSLAQAEAMNALAWQPAGRDLLLAEARLTEDPDVLTPGNDFHAAALNALATIGKATANSGFADRAGSLLFPPPRRLPDTLRILARESWVLFHRRRTKVCTRPEAAEAAVPPRHYRLYHIHLSAETDVGQLVDALATDAGAVVANFPARPVTRLTFAPGLAAVQTGHDDLRSDWQAAVRVDADLHVGVIASGDEAVAEGDALADARLQRVTDLLAPVSQPTEDLTLIRVHRVPVTLAAGHVDGVILYFTKAVATQCHHLYRLVTDRFERVQEQLAHFLDAGGELSLPQFLRQLGAEPLSVSPRFEGGSDRFYGVDEAQRLAAGWELVGNGPISRVLTLAAEESDPQQAQSRLQAVRIANELGSDLSAEDIHYQPAPPRLFPTCPKATLLVTEARCHDVYLFAPSNVDPANVHESLRRLAQESGLTAEMLDVSATFGSIRVTPFTPLQALDFYRDTDRPEADSRQAFQLKWQRELDGTPASSLTGHVLALARSQPGDASATTANVALARRQAQRIAALMDLDTRLLEAVANNADVAFPVDCAALTLVILARPFQAGTLVNRVALALDATLRAGGEETEETRPALSLEFARAVRFNSDNSLIRDDTYAEAVRWFTENAEESITAIEVVSLEGEAGDAAETRAMALLDALREDGLATGNARVVRRPASERERVEIVRSGFALDRGLVLK